MSEEKNEEPLFYDTLFRRKSKKGEYCEVEAPELEGFVADTHVHLQLQRDPALSLARCAVHKVSFLCTIVDAYEDGSATFDELRSWISRGTLGIRRIVRAC